MPKKTKKQLERDKLSRDAAKELKKMKEQQRDQLAKPFVKKKKKKLTEQQKKNVDKDAIIMEKKDIPGSPHFKMVPKKSGQGSNILRAAKGGSASKFPDLSGDGKVTQKDILMGRGVIKRKRGGPVDTPKKKRGNYGPNIGKPFKAMGPVGGLPVNKSGTKIMGQKGLKQIKKISKSLLPLDAASVGAVSAIKGLSKLAGRLAKRGYGKARK